jgi:hypothetical protein
LRDDGGGRSDHWECGNEKSSAENRAAFL